MVRRAGAVGDGRDARRQDDISVLRGVPGHDHGVGLAGSFVKIEALQAGDGWRVRPMAIDAGSVRSLDGGSEDISVDGGHHREGRLHIGVEAEQG